MNYRHKHTHTHAKLSVLGKCHCIAKNYFFYMTLNILNHVSNKTSGANNIDIRDRKSIAGTIIYFRVNVQNSIWSSRTKRAILTQVETELNSPDTFRSRPVNTNTAVNSFNGFSAKHDVVQHSNHRCALFTIFLSFLSNTKSRAPVI